MKNPLRIIGRVTNGEGESLGAVATFEPVDTIRQALAGKVREPIYAVLLPCGNMDQIPFQQGTNVPAAVDCDPDGRKERNDAQ